MRERCSPQRRQVARYQESLLRRYRCPIVGSPVAPIHTPRRRVCRKRIICSLHLHAYDRRPLGGGPVETGLEDYRDVETNSKRKPGNDSLYASLVLYIGVPGKTLKLGEFPLVPHTDARRYRYRAPHKPIAELGDDSDPKARYLFAPMVSEKEVARRHSRASEESAESAILRVIVGADLDID